MLQHFSDSLSICSSSGPITSSLFLLSIYHDQLRIRIASFAFLVSSYFRELKYSEDTPILKIKTSYRQLNFQYFSKVQMYIARRQSITTFSQNGGRNYCSCYRVNNLYWPTRIICCEQCLQHSLGP